MSLFLEKQHLELLISESEIKHKVASVADELNTLYLGQELVIIMVMKGAVCFVADLIRSLTLRVNLDFVRCSSYGAGGVKRSELSIIGLEHLDIKGKNVLLVDDIYDSGNTLATLNKALKAMGPATFRTMVLLNKAIPREVEAEPDYSLFQIGNDFVVGYGLDYKEYYRGLPGIYEIHDPQI